MIVPSNPGVSQPPISTPFQPGGNNTQVGTPEQDPRPNEPQPAQAPAAESQSSQQQTLASPNEETQVAASDENTQQNDPAPPRGSNVDIEV